MRKYFHTNGIEKFGPFSFDDLKEQKLTRETKIWYYGLNKWTALSEIEELKSFFNSIPPPINTTKEIEINEKFDEVPLILESKRNTTKHNYKRWIISISALLFLILIICFMWNNRSDRQLYDELSASAYDIEGVDFNFYVEKFYRDIGNYGIFPKQPKTQIIKFASFEHIDNATHIHGISFGYNDDDKIEIYINPNTWKKFNKPMRYFLMYHELAHDILNLEDLKNMPKNEGKLMYPALESYNEKTMDDFIESIHVLFEEIANR